MFSVTEEIWPGYRDQWFESEELKVTLATGGVIGANCGPRSPGTACILLHHCMGGVALLDERGIAPDFLAAIRHYRPRLQLRA